MAIIETYIDLEVVDTSSECEIRRHFGGLGVDVDVDVCVGSV
jgi:hypothetical protein